MIDWLLWPFATLGVVTSIRWVARALVTGYTILDRLERPPESRKESQRWVGQP